MSQPVASSSAPAAVPAITTIRSTDVRPGYRYPFLPATWPWAIRITPLDAIAHRWEGISQELTLTWVKDDKVLDLYVAGMDSAAFLTHWGLTLSMAKGGFVLSKRLSRLMQPYRFWQMAAPEEVAIAHVAEWDGALWDGCGRVSRLWLMEHILPTLAALPEAQRRAYVQELLTTERWEITLVHAGGEEKGDVLVVDQALLPDGADFAFPVGSAKREVRMQGRVFVGLAQPRHAKPAGIRLDAQSLINLHPFLAHDQLLEWMEAESALFLEGLRTGRTGRLHSRLAADEAGLAQQRQWHVLEYLASGGDPRWFSGITRQLGLSHLHRLVNRVEGRLRFPAPGGRFYLFPAAVGGRDVPRGHVTLEVATATAWVNDADWGDYLVRVLGGCDGDDAVWVLPFSDHDGTRQLLVWRSPNQVGEWVLLRPTAESHEIRWALAEGQCLAWPALDSRRLPPRIDMVGYNYLPLPEPVALEEADQGYSTEAMEPIIAQVEANRAVLGAFCNLMMVYKAVTGRLPKELPASMEAIIDASVKEFRDLTTVRLWLQRTARRMAARRLAIPVSLHHRIEPLLGRYSPAVVATQDHWLDQLVAGVQSHQAAYLAAVEAIAGECIPPAEFFLAIPPEAHAAGRKLRYRYGSTLRCGGGVTAARDACLAYLSRHPGDNQHAVLLAAAARCYLGGETDAVVWQLGAKHADGSREPGIAQQFLAALRRIGLIGEPVWTEEGAVLHWEGSITTTHPTIAVEARGPWYNLLRLVAPDTPARMGDIPKATRDAAKAHIARLAAGPLVGTALTVGQQADRLVLHGPNGHLFGYVPPAQEPRLTLGSTWQVAMAAATDGNVATVLRAA